MNKEEITKEDILNVTGSMFDTMLDYVDNSNKEIEQLEQENKQLKARIDKAIEYLKDNSMCPDDIEVWGQVETDIYKILKGEDNE